MKKAAGLSFILVAAFALSGCATMVSGTTQRVAVTSHPAGAKVTADGKKTATTPMDFTLERKSDHTLEFSKDGYKTTTVMLKRTMNGMGLGNIILGGAIGMGVDMVSGAGNKLIPERVDVKLEEGQGYSESPVFVSQKDQDFYDKNILKPAQDQKKREEEKKQATLKKAETPASKTAATNNFALSIPTVTPAIAAEPSAAPTPPVIGDVQGQITASAPADSKKSQKLYALEELYHQKRISEDECNARRKQLLV